MNVVFGRNDSGKSNLLRALNLFFNEETEPGRGEIDFGLDFSDIRRDAAKAAKGRQFIAIRVDFNVPQNYRPSRTNIHDSYHRSLSQSSAAPLRAAEPGSIDWFFARGVPDSFKARFAVRAEKSLPQDQVDSVAAAAWSFLTS